MPSVIVIRDLQLQIAPLVCTCFCCSSWIFPQFVLAAVCPNDCTLHSLESDGMEAQAVEINDAATVVNSTNSTTAVKADCRKRRPNGVCALKKDASTGTYTSCVSWDQDSGQCNMYKEGVYR